LHARHEAVARRTIEALLELVLDIISLVAGERVERLVGVLDALLNAAGQLIARIETIAVLLGQPLSAATEHQDGDECERGTHGEILNAVEQGW
jgi:hypothetical protein